MTTDFDLRDENWYIKWADDHAPALARVIRRQKERIESMQDVVEQARKMDGYLGDMKDECGNSDAVWMRRLLAALEVK